MMKREHGREQPGVHWAGRFVLRLPFLHYRPEIPDMTQGFLVAGASNMAGVLLFQQLFGLEIYEGMALFILTAIFMGMAIWLFGDPYPAGWITPAVPIILNAFVPLLQQGASYPEMMQRGTAMVLSASVLFIVMGVTGLGKRLYDLTPSYLKAGIILGAAIAAFQQLFTKEWGMSSIPRSIVIAMTVTLILMFSVPFARFRKNRRFFMFLSALGMAPGFVLAILLGVWDFNALFGIADTGGFLFKFLGKEISYANFSWTDPQGGFLFKPPFLAVIQKMSPFYVGWPSFKMFVETLPLAIIVYMLGFWDIVTGSEILKDACRHRPDEKVVIDPTRTHLSVGIRSLAAAFVLGPFICMMGPLWTGAMVVIAERYKTGREHMDSIYSGILSYYWFGVPVLFFVFCLISSLEPALPLALSLTIGLTGYACAYVAMSLLKDNVERGIAFAIGAVLAFGGLHGPVWALVAALVLGVLIMGPPGAAGRDAERPGD